MSCAIICDSCGRDFHSHDDICPHCDYNNGLRSEYPTGKIIEFENTEHVMPCLNCDTLYDTSRNWKCPSCGQRTEINETGDQNNGESEWI